MIEWKFCPIYGLKPYTTVEKRKPLAQTEVKPSTTARLAMCSVSSVSMWYTEDNYAARGYWETRYITTCTENPGDGGTGGTGDINPCQKMKDQSSNANFKAKVSELDKPEMFTKDVETGFAAAYGALPFQQIVNGYNGLICAI
ncbi:hypothetical protein AAEU33_20315 [Chryseobacterium sp. Chry.R1]|uniref:hypothetical protein n=1 Tax=Chryseobacterium sp. Chry.R1 TaxID=3139392 RepID=UPI0031F8368F